MLDITEQLEECKIALNENQQEIIARLATQYVNALERSIRERIRGLWQQGSPNFQEPLLQGQH